MSIRPSLLIVEDEKNEREGLRKFLSPRGYEIFLAGDAEASVKIVKEENPDIVLTDLVLPGKDGLWLLEKIKSMAPESTVIIFTSYGTVENAVRAIKQGAFHYLTKPLDFDELETTLDRALKSKQLERENVELKKELLEKTGYGEIVAESSTMKEVMGMVKRVAPTTASVLLEGESGTGKEVLAHLIHDWSLRKDQPFVTVHCAALTESLLSSELFGHEKGAFTGASERKIGRFERAHTGTLFLDEISEIKEDLQVKLLRVLQNGEFERVGGIKSLKADVRLICATNKNLLEEVRNLKFREDLYYRINVIKVTVPPLRNRKEDIPLLARYFIKYFSRINNKPIESIDDNAMKIFEEYYWPGNVRELRNVVERMVVLATESKLTRNNIPLDIRESRPASDFAAATSPTLERKSYPIRDMEREMIEKKLREVSGNKSKTAKELGISRRTLYRKLDEYNIKSEEKN